MNIRKALKTMRAAGFMLKRTRYGYKVERWHSIAESLYWSDLIMPTEPYGTWENDELIEWAASL